MMIAFLLPVLVILVYSNLQDGSFIIGCCKIEGNYLEGNYLELLVLLQHLFQSLPVEDVTAGLLQVNWDRSWRVSCLGNTGLVSVLQPRLCVIEI